MAWRRWFLSACAIASGCDSSARLFVATPDVIGQSTIVATREDGTWAAAAYTGTRDWHREGAAPYEVVALTYELSLEELGLDPGPIDRPAGVSCRILDPSKVHVLEGEEESTVWRELPRPPDEISRLLVADPLPCERCSPFAHIPRASSEKGRGSAAARLESGAIVAAFGRSFFAVTPEAARRIDCERGGGWALRAVGGDELWVGDSNDELRKIRIDEENASCEVLTSTLAPNVVNNGQPVRTVHALAGGRQGEPLYVMVDDGSLFSFDESSGFKHLHTLPIHPGELPEQGGHGLPIIVELPDGALAFTSGWTEIGWWKDGSLERIDTIEPEFAEFHPDGADRITALSYVEGFGLLAGLFTGEIFRFQVGVGWEPYASRLQSRIGAIAGFGPGLVVTLNGGRVNQWHPERGWCPDTIELGAQGGDGDLLLVRDRTLAIVDFAGDSRSFGGVDWLIAP